MKILAVINLLILFFTNVLTAENIVCNGTLELQENEILFFESPNFPLLVNKTILNKCEIKITGDSAKVSFHFI